MASHHLHFLGSPNSSWPDTNWDNHPDGDLLHLCLCWALRLQALARLWDLLILGQTFHPSLVQKDLQFKVSVRKRKSRHYLHAYFTSYPLMPPNTQGHLSEPSCFSVIFTIWELSSPFQHTHSLLTSQLKLRFLQFLVFVTQTLHLYTLQSMVPLLYLNTNDDDIHIFYTLLYLK